MSTAFAYAARRPSGVAHATGEFDQAPEVAERPGLIALPAPAIGRKPSVVVAGALLAGVGCVLALQLVISIQSAAGAYSVDALTARSIALAREEAVRRETLAALAAPQHLAARATELGMVPSVQAAYLRVPDGRVVGSDAAGLGTSTPQTALVPDAALPAG